MRALMSVKHSVLDLTSFKRCFWKNIRLFFPRSALTFSFRVIIGFLIARCRLDVVDPVRGCCRAGLYEKREKADQYTSLLEWMVFGWADTLDRGCATGILYFPSFSPYFPIFFAPQDFRSDEWMGKSGCAEKGWDRMEALTSAGPRHSCDTIDRSYPTLDYFNLSSFRCFQWHFPFVFIFTVVALRSILTTVSVVYCVVASRILMIDDSISE